MSVLLLGSSHIRRLEDYIRRRPQLRQFALNNPPVVNYHGISGGHITTSEHTNALMTSVNFHQPEHVLLHIGGNDLDKVNIKSSDVEEIILKLVTFAHTIIGRYNVQSVTICQLLNREKTRHVLPEAYNELVKQANKLLKKELSTIPHIYYWKISGVKYTTTEILEDGVHFNNKHGMPRYFRNLRGAIIQAII